MAVLYIHRYNIAETGLHILMNPYRETDLLFLLLLLLNENETLFSCS
jgi:hypothetical protein